MHVEVKIVMKLISGSSEAGIYVVGFSYPVVPQGLYADPLISDTK